MEIKTIMDIAIVKADKLDILGKDKKGWDILGINMMKYQAVLTVKVPIAIEVVEKATVELGKVEARVINQKSE